MHTVKWLNCSIGPIDWMLTSTTTLGQNSPGSNSNERILHIPQNSRTTRWFSIVSRTLVGKGLTLLQRYNQHIQQPQQTGLFSYKIKWGKSKLLRTEFHDVQMNLYPYIWSLFWSEAWKLWVFFTFYFGFFVL